MPSQTPRPPKVREDDPILHVRSWVAKSLAAERNAILEHMMSHHEALLEKLDVHLRDHQEFGLLLAEAKGLESKPNGDQETQEPVDTNTIDIEEIQPVEGIEWQEVVAPAPITDFSPKGSMATQAGKAVSRIPSSATVSGDDILKRFVTHPIFDAFFIGIILLNTFQAVLEAQYLGFDIGYDLKHPDHTATAASTWPSAREVFDAAEFIFAALYTVEIALKLIALKMQFFASKWNLFDLFLVGFWYLNEATGVGTALNPMVLRLARLARLMRIVRHVGWFQSFDSLHMLLLAITSSFSVLVWSSLVLFMLFVISALTTGSFLSEYLQDPHELPSKRREVYKFFGTFTRSFISMYEMAFHNHAPIMRVVVENVDESWAIYFLAYKTIFGLSIMKVIMGVFLHETFKVCSEDDELMIIQKKRATKAHTKKMTKLFHTINSDDDGDGEDGEQTLSWTEFEQVMKNDWIKCWLSAMDLDTSNTERLWNLLDNGDGKLTADELVKGVTKLKGAAKSVDLHHNATEVAGLIVAVDGIHETLRKMQEDKKETAGKQESGALASQLTEALVSVGFIKQAEIPDSPTAEGVQAIGAQKGNISWGGSLVASEMSSLPPAPRKAFRV